MKIINKRLAELIVTRRRALGLTQQQVGDALIGRTRNAQSVSNIERGATQLSPRHVKKLSVILDCSIDEITRAMKDDYEESILHEIGEL